ncbi:uncharacterized protein MYCFIDRAFT_179923 [Pseudocercospora fijiensis CIRAD86]|uniref:Uncharacterized protein n=1 Tax=Pseudocercospora fijiensis (strain CIRAD86) TaxID=383855 RepID=M2ZE04_PSEFD|nr:uncharacterized protein MYCFIDRAFT_179923 [Pseudocercospora fijiensis CIRAD86]EME77349.1 hypothetical protein MYCFIDRAFT_179923 [Pseudocercospora fijiensis CIRAD86]
MSTGRRELIIHFKKQHLHAHVPSIHLLHMLYTRLSSGFGYIESTCRLHTKTSSSNQVALLLLNIHHRLFPHCGSERGSNIDLQVMHFYSNMGSKVGGTRARANTASRGNRKCSSFSQLGGAGKSPESFEASSLCDYHGIEQDQEHHRQRDRKSFPANTLQIHPKPNSHTVRMNPTSHPKTSGWILIDAPEITTLHLSIYLSPPPPNPPHHPQPIHLRPNPPNIHSLPTTPTDRSGNIHQTQEPLSPLRDSAVGQSRVIKMYSISRAAGRSGRSSRARSFDAAAGSAVGTNDSGEDAHCWGGGGGDPICMGREGGSTRVDRTERFGSTFLSIDFGSWAVALRVHQLYIDSRLRQVIVLKSGSGGRMSFALRRDRQDKFAAMGRASSWGPGRIIQSWDRMPDSYCGLASATLLKQISSKGVRKVVISTELLGNRFANDILSSDNDHTRDGPATDKGVFHARPLNCRVENPNPSAAILLTVQPMKGGMLKTTQPRRLGKGSRQSLLFGYTVAERSSHARYMILLVGQHTLKFAAEERTLLPNVISKKRDWT